MEKEGKVKRTIDNPRLSEIVEDYESLDFEVRLEAPKLEELDDECRKCYGKQINKINTV